MTMRVTITNDETPPARVLRVSVKEHLPTSTTISHIETIRLDGGQSHHFYIHAARFLEVFEDANATPDVRRSESPSPVPEQTPE